MFCKRCARDCKQRVHGLLLQRLQQGSEIGPSLLVDEVVVLQSLDGLPNITRQRVELRAPFIHEFFHLLHSTGFIGTLLRRGRVRVGAQAVQALARRLQLRLQGLTLTRHDVIELTPQVIQGAVRIVLL